MNPITNRFCSLAALALLIFLFTGCEKKETYEPSGESIVKPTEMKLVYTDQEDKATVINYVDVDGPGGNDPIKDNIVLEVGNAYDLEISLLKSGEQESLNITGEVRNQAESYRMCVTHNLPLEVKINDNDANGFSLGLESGWEPRDAKSGQITFNLYYQKDIKDGSCEVGQLAFTATFNITLN